MRRTIHNREAHMKTFSVILALALAMTARAAAQSSDSTQANAQASADSIYTTYQVDKQATLAKRRSPEYPEALRRRHIQGEVTVQFVVDTSGLVDSTTITITSSTNPLFAASARKAVKRSKFVSAERNGKKVKEIVDMKFTFTIRPDEMEQVR
jgi:TonB family protein